MSYVKEIVLRGLVIGQLGCSLVNALLWIGIIHLVRRSTYYPLGWNETLVLMSVLTMSGFLILRLLGHDSQQSKVEGNGNH